MLLLMPGIERISGSAHLPFLVPEVFRAVDRQFVHQGTDQRSRSRSSQSTLQVAAQREYQLVFAVNFRNEHAVLLFRPFEVSHANNHIIASRVSSCFPDHFVGILVFAQANIVTVSEMSDLRFILHLFMGWMALAGESEWAVIETLCLLRLLCR